MQLFYRKNFTVVRQITDHTDTTVYFVQAVIRNAFTDEIIATLNLDHKGSQRYKKDWTVPADSSGEPYYVSIVTSVYTDDTYTTKSPSYGDEENTYQVSDVQPNKVGSGGGLSRRDVRDIIQEELQNIKFPKPEPIKFPKQKEVDLSPVLDAIKAVPGQIKEVEIPEVNFKPILDALDSLKYAIESVEIPEVDINPILDKIDALDKVSQEDKDEIKKMIEAKDFFNDFEERVTNALSKIKLTTSSVTFVDEGGLPALHRIKDKDFSKKEEESSIDINKLTS